MANGMNGTPQQRKGAPARNGSGNPPKKADVIIQITRDISRKQEDVRNQTQLINSRLESVAEVSNQSRDNAQEAINRSDIVYNLITDSITALKHEITYLAAQSENIYLNLAEKLAELNNALDELSRVKEAASEKHEGVEETAKEQVDYDAIADKLAERLPRHDPDAQETAIDYDLLSDKIAEKIPAPVVTTSGGETPVVTVQPAEIDYDLLSDKIAGKMPAPVHQYSANTPVATAQPVGIDYDELSAKVVSMIPVQETISTDYIASKVAEQIVIPSSASDIDYDTLAKKVAECVGSSSNSAPAPVVVTSGGDVTVDYEYLADKVASKVASQNGEPAVLELDYEALAEKVADKIISEKPAEEPAVLELDYEALAEKVADKIISEKPAEEPAVLELDYDTLSDMVANKLSAQNESNAPIDIDYDLLADKVADRVNTENTAEPAAVEIDYDLLADKVADRVNTENTAEPAAVEIDYEVLADKVADRIISEMPAQTANGEIDLDALADKVAERVPAAQQVQTIAAALPSSPVEVNIDEDELADKIALKVGAIKSDDFDIIVDEDGCESISKAITEKIDYNIIAETVSEKIRTAIQPVNGNEPDYDEIANRIGDKIQVAGVNEDAIADKAAAALSGCLPEIDTDYIADKVANQVLEALSANNDVLADKVAGKVADSLPQNEDEEEEALRIELDYEDLAEKVAAHLNSSIPESAGKEESVTDKVEEKETVTAQAQISEEDLDKVADKITKVSGERFDSIDKDLEEIKSLLESGVKVSELAPAAAEQTIAEDSEEELVTVSDIVSETEEPSDEETFEEDVLDPKAQPSEDEESLEIGDELLEASDGVDFLNMMKYDRSFIARIIQGTDDQKVYYGRIKHALLSYKKVNSNIAWGAERFHKGRETIARLKIRGKTLILYLALDPAEFPYSVYHQKDVSNNKSLHGTPLAVKVMSPLGVKKAIRLIDAMLEKRDGIKKPVPERNYAEMYPYETIEELIADGLVHDVKKP